MDLGKSFNYVFKDEKWIETILIGGLITLVPILGWLYLGGFMIVAARRVVEGKTDLLPEWGQVGQKIGDGFNAFVITFIYALPAIVVGLLVGILGVLMVSQVDDGGQVGMMGQIFEIFMAGCFVPFLFLLGIILQVLSLAGLAMFIRSNRVRDGLQFREAYRMVRARLGNYLILWFVQFLASTIGGVGIYFFGIGMLFTMVFAQAFFGNYFGQFIQAYVQRTGVTRV